MATLVLPVFVFLFLKFFSQNHFALPRLIPQVDSLTGKVQMAEAIHPITGKKFVDTVYHTIPNFNLLDQDSLTFTKNRLKGKISIASFIFTRCGTICPKTVASMARVQENFENSNDILLLSYTVDPQYDRPSILKKFSKSNEINNQKWVLLTGSKSSIYNLALKGYMVPVSDASEYNKAITNPDQAFIHSERLILVDKEGIIRGFYDGTDRKEVDKLILETKILVDIYSKQKYGAK